MSKYKFRSVNITHDILHRIDFSYIAELFRFMGILVCENILFDDSKSENQTEETVQDTIYSADIYIGKRSINAAEAEALGCSDEEYHNKLKELSDRAIYLYDDPYIQAQQKSQNVKDFLPAFIVCRQSCDVQKRIIRDFLINILDSIYAESDEEVVSAGQLEKLIDIYVENGLWLHSMNMQYYAQRRSDAISEAKVNFLSAYEALEKVLMNKENMGAERRLYEYALLWCKVKINNACNYGKEMLYFPLEDVANGCRNLCAAYPDFSNAKILLGLCYEPSSNSANEALAAFDSALKELQDECFSSAVYYWMGKRYEPYFNRKELAKKAYNLAYQKKPKFRSIFKLAIAAKDNGDNERAIEKFDEILWKLKLKEELHFLDPLEIEYQFKIYVQKCYIYYKDDNVIAAIKAGEEAVRIKNTVDNKEMNDTENLFFNKFYGGDSDRYRKILTERFSVNVVYKMLSECYSKIFKVDKAREYQKKIVD